MKSIAFFNNKGGVGKTTLTCNLANFVADRHEKRVLIVDLDPQCNATQLVLPPETCQELYWDDVLEHRGGDLTTIFDAVMPLNDGDANISAAKALPPSSNRFGVGILPGDPRMSALEDQLGPWFRDATAGEISGLRKTLWVRELLEQFNERFDVVIFDLGPSLGALNRSVLATCDYFVTPMGADIFSLVAIRNMADWIEKWSKLYSQGVALCEERSPGSPGRYQIPSSLKINSGFAGYTVQQYSTVSIRGERRATVAYEEIISRIPSEIRSHLQKFLPPNLTTETAALGDVPNLRSLIPLAQTANSPLSRLTARDGLAGGQYSQQRTYTDVIEQVGKRLVENCELA